MSKKGPQTLRSFAQGFSLEVVAKVFNRFGGVCSFADTQIILSQRRHLSKIKSPADRRLIIKLAQTTPGNLEQAINAFYRHKGDYKKAEKDLVNRKIS